MAATTSYAADPVEITVQRFFGACDAEYGSVADATQARGECGIITALVGAPVFIAIVRRQKVREL